MKQFMIGFGQQLVKMLLSHKTAIFSIVGAVAGSLALQLQAGHVNWALVAGAALTVIAGLAKSATGIQSTPTATVNAPSGTPE